MNNKWKVITVSISDIVGTPVNANSMDKEDFNKLVTNIRKSGLSSMIACYKRKEDGKYEIISGNHRFMAVCKLGWSELTILYADEEELTRDEIIAVQLSHNSLHGSDDKNILKKLIDEIESIDFKEFAHISMDDIEVNDMFSSSLVPVSEHYKVSLVLYKKDIDLIEDLLELVEEEKQSHEMVILADGNGNEDEFLDLIAKVKKDHKIKSSSIAFSKILEMAKGGSSDESEKD